MVEVIDKYTNKVDRVGEVIEKYITDNDSVNFFDLKEEFGSYVYNVLNKMGYSFFLHFNGGLYIYHRNLLKYVCYKNSSKRTIKYVYPRNNRFVKRYVGNKLVDKIQVSNINYKHNINWFIKTGTLNGGNEMALGFIEYNF